jgi:SH3-like domain-containing protein
MRPVVRLGLCAVIIMAAASACATEFRSVSENAAVMYDAPSAKSKKMHVINRGYPVEIIVAVEGWFKVRDAGGELAWVEAKSLSERRSLMVKVKLADVRQSASDNAPLAFQVEQNVLLDLVELTDTGWARVTHRDGQSGYIRINLVWGV